MLCLQFKVCGSLLFWIGAIRFQHLQEEAERKRKEEEEQREHEEYLKMKEAFVVEEEGQDADLEQDVS